MAKNNEKFVSRENAKTLWGYMVALLTGKQNKLTFDDTPTQSSDNPVKSGGIFAALSGKGTYSKPQNGIPKTDLENAVQTSLGLADSALQSETDPTVPSWAKQTNKPSYTQDEVGDGTTYKRVSSTEKDTWNAKGTYSKPSGGIPKSDLASAVQTSLEKADSALQSETDPTVPSWAKQSSKPSYNSDEISDTNRTHKFATQSQLNQISTNQTNILLMMNGVNHNMIYRGNNLGASLTDAQHTALSSGNFTDLYLGDYWTKSVTIPAGTYTGGDGEEVTVAAQTVTLKAVIADFDTFYAGYASTYAGINTHHAGLIVTGFNNVVWNKTNSTAGGYVSSLIHKWLVGSVLPQIETWFGSAKVLSHQKLLTNAITGDAASNWAWSSQKISLLSECQLYGMKVWGGSKATNGAYEPGEAFKKLDIFNHIDANLLFGNKNIWCRDITSAGGAARLISIGDASNCDASHTGSAPAALILLS